MTICNKYNKNKVVPVQYAKFEEDFLLSNKFFSILILKKGIMNLQLNNINCFLNEKVVVCANKSDNIELLLKSEELIIDVLQFDPEFININLSYETINSPGYNDICQKHQYPDFKPFLERTSKYNGILLLDENGYKKIDELMYKIEYQLSEQPDEEWSCRSRDYLFQIMAIFKIYFEKYNSISIQNNFVWEICKYVNLNLDNNLSIEYLSKKFSINRTTLNDKFKAGFGTTISEYIRTKRIEHIKYLLSFTELSITEIAEQVGICDQAYLNKMFFKFTGYIPSEYRKMMRDGRSDKF